MHINIHKIFEKRYFRTIFGICLLQSIFCLSTFAQPEFTPWGNLRGIKIEGEKIPFETSLRSVNTNWDGYISTEQYNWEGKQEYKIEGKTQIVSHYLLGLPLAFNCKMTETGIGSAHIEYEIKAEETINQAGTFFCMEVPGKTFTNGKISFYFDNNKEVIELNQLLPNKKNILFSSKATKIVLEKAGYKYEITPSEPVDVNLRKDFIDNPAYKNDRYPKHQFVSYDSVMQIADYQLYFTVLKGNAKKGDQKKIAFDVKAIGPIDKDDVLVSIDPNNPGRRFEGIGGNFRLQFSELDPAVIQYCLDSMDVTWARVPLYWDDWQPEENTNSIERAKAGLLDKNFYRQMELTRMLAKRNMKIIVSVWAPPSWAVDQNIKVQKGVVLDNKKIEQISASIASFLIFIKQEYGIETDYFSFNETDYGVEIYQTKENHAFQYKEIGNYLKKKGLITKILLGDTGAGTEKASQIMDKSLKDSSLHSYAGAISFHTYHGCTTSDLKAWAQTAQKSNLPILVAEGGPNSATHRYPLVFLQPWFQLEEIDMYVRICNICQPINIMEWQLTADYSVLTGNGLYGDNGPLHPTQRFWNLKQLGSTPFGSFSIPAKCSKENVSTAAFSDIKNHLFTIHFVNNGAKRKVKISGIPSDINTLNIYKTDAVLGMAKGESIQNINGVAEFELDANCFTTITNTDFKK